MENELLGIGRLASLSGLPVSALRFYDGAGVFRPATVDPVSGYRFYRPGQVVQARLVAHLRRVGLPLDEIRTVLAEPAHAASNLATHLDRLEAGLADARREISIVHRLLDNTEITMTHCTLPAADLIRALRHQDAAHVGAVRPPRPAAHGGGRRTARRRPGGHPRRRRGRRHHHPHRWQPHRPGPVVRRGLPALPQLARPRCPAGPRGRRRVAGRPRCRCDREPHPHHDGALSILMPVRLDQPA